MAAIRHLRQKLWQFEFARGFRVQFRASWYIMICNQTYDSKVIAVLIWKGFSCPISSVSIYYGHNLISESKVKPVWIWHELPCSIFRVLIYYGQQSDIWVQSFAVWICLKLAWSISRVLIYYGPLSDIQVKSYECLNLLITFVINFKSLDILWAAIKHPR